MPMDPGPSRQNVRPYPNKNLCNVNSCSHLQKLTNIVSELVDYLTSLIIQLGHAVLEQWSIL